VEVKQKVAEVMMAPVVHDEPLKNVASFSYWMAMRWWWLLLLLLSSSSSVVVVVVAFVLEVAAVEVYDVIAPMSVEAIVDVTKIVSIDDDDDAAEMDLSLHVALLMPGQVVVWTTSTHDLLINTKIQLYKQSNGTKQKNYPHSLFVNRRSQAKSLSLERKKKKKKKQTIRGRPLNPFFYSHFFFVKFLILFVCAL
jgi:hypothetical protein